MRTKIVYLGGLGQATGKKEEILELESPTLGDLLQQILERHSGRLRELIIDETSGNLSGHVIFAVNGQETRDLSTRIEQEDEILLLPIMVGGL